jgi:hypothetical protein
VFVIFALIAIPAAAQGGPQPPSDGFPLELRNYFGLSDDQVRQIVFANETYQSAAGVQAAKMQQLQQQIDAETQRPVLDPITLGNLYVASEQARRAQQAARTQAINAIVAVLTPAQRVKLQALQDALNLQPLIDLAVKQNFLLLSSVAPQPAPTALPYKLPEFLRSLGGQSK